MQVNRVTKASGASRIGASEEMGIINGKNLRRREGKLRFEYVEFGARFDLLLEWRFESRKIRCR